MWIALISIVICVMIIIIIILLSANIPEAKIPSAKISLAKIPSAKNNFNKLVLLNITMQERTKEECELKMNDLQKCKITFSNWWLLFWGFYGLGIGFVICIVIGCSNKTTRLTYKSQELTRLQTKINNFIKIEISNKN